MLIVLVVRGEWFLYIVMLQQNPARPGIFTQQHISVLQNSDGPVGDITEVAYRRWNKVKHVPAGLTFSHCEIKSFHNLVGE